MVVIKFYKKVMHNNETKIKIGTAYKHQSNKMKKMGWFDNKEDAIKQLKDKIEKKNK